MTCPFSSRNLYRNEFVFSHTDRSTAGLADSQADGRAIVNALCRDAPVHTLRDRQDGDSRWTDPRLDMRGFNKRDVKSHRMCHYVARRSVGLIFAVLRRWRAI